MRLIHKLLARLGLKVERIRAESPLDLRDRGNHPFLLAYHSLPRPILVDVPVRWGRGFRTLPLDDPTAHPFVRASALARNASDPVETVTAVLRSYYQAVQPVDVLGWLRVPGKSESQLAGQKPASLSMPWDVRTPDEWLRARESWAIQEGRRAGQVLSLADGWHFWGPVSEVKLSLEVGRLSNLVDSVIRKGIVRSDVIGGDIQAVVLRTSQGRWRWQVAGGEHRAAVYSAIGVEEVPVRVIQIVTRDDAEIWPGVTSGIYSVADALAIFDQVFEGKAPDLVSAWSRQAAIC